MLFTADYWIQHLQLTAHVEGGAYCRNYCATLSIPRENLPAAFHGARPAATAIYFLLQQYEISAMHRIASDELWHFYYGDALEIYEIDVQGQLSIHLLGNNPLQQESFQCLINAGSWFGSAVKKMASMRWWVVPLYQALILLILKWATGIIYYSCTRSIRK